MNLYLAPIPTALILATLVLVALLVGRRLGSWFLQHGTPLDRGVGAIEGIIYAMLGLLVSFTFSGTANRFEARRALMTQEANAVHSAWLRLDILNDPERGQARVLFRDYLDERMAAYEALPDETAARAHLARAQDLEDELWAAVVTAVRRPDAVSSTQVIVLPALTTMFDAARMQAAAIDNHPPNIIYLLLMVMATFSALFAGVHGAQNPSRRIVHAYSLAFLLGFALFVILELEYPRRGIVQADSVDHLMYELRDKIDQQTR